MVPIEFLRTTPERLVFSDAAFARDVGMLGSAVHVPHENIAAAVTTVDWLNFHIETVDVSVWSPQRLTVILDAATPD